MPSTIVPLISGAAPPEGTNFGVIKNADYEAAVAKAAGLVGTEACAVWGDGEKALFSKADVVPFASAPSNTYLNKVKPLFGTVSLGPAVRLQK